MSPKFQINLYLTAAVLLLGLGIYFFLFERSEIFWWAMLLGGALMNLLFAYQIKRNEDE